MNDRQIACFLEAVKERNFTKVAEKLYLTQPGVSRMIATLEKELNTKLFARSAHKTLELTESGKLYYEMFEKCRREFEETKRKSELIQRENTDITTLKFGYVRGWSITGFYPLMLDALQEEFPYLNVDLESHSYERLYDLLYSGNLDFILTMNFPEMEKLHSDLEVMEICQVPQAVIYPKEFGTKKDIADFQDSVFYLSADAPVEYSRANLEQIGRTVRQLWICGVSQFMTKNSNMCAWKHRFRSLECSEKTVPMQKLSGCCMRRWRNATGKKS